MDDRKAYRKTWMANRRKVKRLNAARARTVNLSDSDSDDRVNGASPECLDAPVFSDQADIEGGACFVEETCPEVNSEPSDSELWHFIDVECSREEYSDSDECDTESGLDTCIAETLRAWVVDSGVNQLQVTKLLHSLKPFHPDLPLMAETLLKTTSNKTLQCRSLSGGEYVYLGFRESLCKVVSDTVHLVELQLALNVDGLPLFSSSTYSVWPVLCYVMNDSLPRVFVVGLYGGYSKPRDLEFLKETVDELAVLSRDGLEVNGRNVSCVARMCVCDAVARAMVKGVKLFSGYCGCDKCSQKGLYIGRMTYPDVNCPVRTDTTFRNMENEQHHNGPSPFIDLPVDMIQFFPIDYMHSVCLGVMKRILVCWTSGGNTVRLSHIQRCQINARLAAFRSSVSKEFSRKPRSLSDLSHWKATEFRTFLLYAGYICLRGIIDDLIFEHFMYLSVAVAIFVSQELCRDQNMKQFAHDLLVYFVNRAGELYGPEFLVYNVHCLIHLSAEVDHFGPLDNSSAFIFENFMQTIKKSVKSARNPLMQIVHRLEEKKKFSKLLPTTRHVLEISVGQYSASPPNNTCILDDGRCCQVVSVGMEYVTCMVYSNTQPLYTAPCDSRWLGVFRASLSSGVLKQLPLNLRTKKALSFIDTAKSEIIFMKLLHTV